MRGTGTRAPRSQLRGLLPLFVFLVVIIILRQVAVHLVDSKYGRPPEVGEQDSAVPSSGSGDLSETREVDHHNAGRKGIGMKQSPPPHVAAKSASDDKQKGGAIKTEEGAGAGGDKASAASTASSPPVPAAVQQLPDLDPSAPAHVCWVIRTYKAHGPHGSG